MDNIKETLRRNINEEKITKLSRNKFLEAFVKGSDYEEDFKYLKDELPEFLNDFYVNDKWTDKKGLLREVKDDYFIVCEPKNGQYFIIGEIKFDKVTKKPIFGRFSETGAFSRTDNLIVNKKEVIRGNIPEDEWLYSLKEKEPSYYHYLTYEKTGKSRLNIEYSKFSKVLQMEFKEFKTKKELSLHIEYGSTPLIIFYRLKKIYVDAVTGREEEDIIIEKAASKTTKTKLDKDIEFIKDSFYEFINDDFKNEKLSTYVDFYNRFEKMTAMY